MKLSTENLGPLERGEVTVGNVYAAKGGKSSQRDDTKYWAVVAVKEHGVSLLGLDAEGHVATKRSERLSLRSGHKVAHATRLRKSAPAKQENNMKHRLYETGDHGAPAAILDRNGEVALDLCKICGGAEAAMPTDCPGTGMTPQQLDEVTAGALDYRGSTWVTPNAGVTGAAPGKDE